MSSFYMCKNVNLADLLEPNFMNEHIRTGSLVALSTDTSEDADIVAFDGRGRLVMNVSKDTYEQLGLSGRRSAHGVTGQRFKVQLSDISMRSGKPGFEKIRTALRNWPHQKASGLWSELAGVARSEVVRGKTFDMLMTFVDDKDNLVPIVFPNAVTATRRTSVHSRSSIGDIKVPIAVTYRPEDVKNPSGKRQQSKAGVSLDFQEWLGLVACSACQHLKWDPDGDDDAQRPWGTPQDDCKRGSVLLASWTGFLHPRLLPKITSAVIASCSFAEVDTRFIAVHMRPPPNSPLSHLPKANPQIVNTTRKPNGGKRKRGRGRGEEDEAEPQSVQTKRDGWQLVVSRTNETTLTWILQDIP
ncbi:hypothetical protein OIV83_002951 [Microbotryomycetes sp. JL201]|nr:hypothetical protein OIV83_002951 [Microbotryomycetes sp. JL201]